MEENKENTPITEEQIPLPIPPQTAELSPAPASNISSEDVQDMLAALEKEQAADAEFNKHWGNAEGVVLPAPELANYWLDIGNRTLYLTDEVVKTNVQCQDIINWIKRWNKEDAEANVAVEDRTPIKLYINSPGGNLCLSLSIADTILLSKTPVYGINEGMCASGASLIYVACDKRFAYPSSSFLLHLGSGVLSGSYAVLSASKRDYDWLVQRMKNIYKRQMTVNEKDFDTLIQNEWYLYAEDAPTPEQNAWKYNLVTDLICNLKL